MKTQWFHFNQPRYIGVRIGRYVHVLATNYKARWCMRTARLHMRGTTLALHTTRSITQHGTAGHFSRRRRSISSPTGRHMSLKLVPNHWTASGDGRRRTCSGWKLRAHRRSGNASESSSGDIGSACKIVGSLLVTCCATSPSDARVWSDAGCLFGIANYTSEKRFCFCKIYTSILTGYVSTICYGTCFSLMELSVALRARALIASVKEFGWSRKMH